MWRRPMIIFVLLFRDMTPRWLRLHTLASELLYNTIAAWDNLGMFGQTFDVFDHFDQVPLGRTALR